MKPIHSMSLATVVVKTAGIPDAEVDNEVVILGIEKSVCYGLNSVGSRIWQLLVGQVRVSDICKSLQNEYDIDAANCETQVLTLLENLRSEGLIEIFDDSRAAPLNTAS